MASSKAYLDFILDQLSGLDEISCRAMMGEYILYYRGKIIGGLYDDRFLVKLTPSARAMMPQAEMELPYEGAKEMLLVDNVESREFLTVLIDDIADAPGQPMARRKWYGGASTGLTMARNTAMTPRVLRKASCRKPS